ncbi:MAG: ATP phosphoribosyltransferase regulatory subunit [Bacteriovoracaceae bacterium]
MNLNKNPYKGSRDFFPKDKRVLNYLFEKMRIAAEKFGYEPYDGPLLEEVELYKAKSGEELINDQIYDFIDRGKRHVAIRPEMTPTLARMVAQIHQETPKPIRYYAIPNLMRYEQPQKGRLREHWQFNCDIFGAPDTFGEIEIIQIIISLLKSLKANQNHFEVLINNRKIVDFVFKNLLECSDDLSYKLYKIVDKSKKVSKEALEEMLNKTDLAKNKYETFYQYLHLKSFSELEIFLTQNSFENPLTPFIQKMHNLNLIDYLVYDPTIVRIRLLYRCSV